MTAITYHGRKSTPTTMCAAVLVGDDIQLIKFTVERHGDELVPVSQYGRVRLSIGPKTVLVGFGQARRARERVQRRLDADTRYFRADSAAPGWASAVRNAVINGESDHDRRIYLGFGEAIDAEDAVLVSLSDEDKTKLRALGG